MEARSKINWFNGTAEWKIGGGENIKFWHDTWFGQVPLENTYPGIFLYSTHTKNTIGSIGVWIGGIWKWNLIWHREGFEWEEIMVNFLEGLLQNVNIKKDVSDEWFWRDEKSELYTIKSKYIAMCVNLMEIQHMEIFYHM